MISNRLLKDLIIPEGRQAYLEARTMSRIAFQIRALRKQADRNWSQAELAARLGKPAPNVSRLENPDRGQYTVNTLLEIAHTFDVALLVTFCSYGEFLQRTSNMAYEALEVPSFNPDQLEMKWE